GWRQVLSAAPRYSQRDKVGSHVQAGTPHLGLERSDELRAFVNRHRNQTIANRGLEFVGVEFRPLHSFIDCLPGYRSCLQFFDVFRHFSFHRVCSELGRNCIILVLNALTHCLSASSTRVKRESSSFVSRTFEQLLARRRCSAPVPSGSQCICATSVP